MPRVLLLSALALSASAATPARAVLATALMQVETNVPTFDPVAFGPGPNIDVYHFVLKNFFDSPVTSVQANLPGEWVNRNVPELTFKNGVGLPALGPNLVAETFFVVPDGRTPAQILPVNVVDNSTALAAFYTLQGGGVFVPARGNAVVAVLSTPTGVSPDPSFFSIAAVVDGQLERPLPWPEPSTGLLAACGAALAATRRRF